MSPHLSSKMSWPIKLEKTSHPFIIYQDDTTSEQLSFQQFADKVDSLADFLTLQKVKSVIGIYFDSSNYNSNIQHLLLDQKTKLAQGLRTF